MRTSKQTASEIEAMELAEDVRRRNRLDGFSLANIRDRGWTVLSNGVRIAWPVNREAAPYEALRRVPDGHFILDVHGQEYLFDTEEFRKWIRWA